MSILWHLRRYVDSMQQRKEEAEVRRAREALPPDFEGHTVDDPPTRDANEPTKFRCTLCGLEGDQNEYCPACLTLTMKPVE
jgi:hypothetical protein